MTRDIGAVVATGKAGGEAASATRGAMGGVQSGEGEDGRPLFRQLPPRRRNWCGRLCSLLFAC